MERISFQSDIVDVNTIFKELATMVHEQGEMIDSIEANVETAQMRVEEGTSQLATAASYQVIQIKFKLDQIEIIKIIIIISFADKNTSKKMYHSDHSGDRGYDYNRYNCLAVALKFLRPGLFDPLNFISLINANNHLYIMNSDYSHSSNAIFLFPSLLSHSSDISSSIIPDKCIIKSEKKWARKAIDVIFVKFLHVY